MPPRTIDNLGMDVSTRYAEDQKKLDQQFIKEAKTISTQTQIDVTLPSYASEFDLLFETARRNLPWAGFYAPDKYNEQKKRLFTHQLIPSLGTEDKKESQAQKILAKIKSQVARQQREEKEGQGEKKKFDQQREIQEEEKEKKILIKLLDCVIALDKYMIDVNSRRTQYQKG